MLLMVPLLKVCIITWFYVWYRCVWTARCCSQLSEPLEVFHVGCSSWPQVYSLMGNRLEKQCKTLQISHEIRQKIWTCFDHSLVHFTDLMVDRHLDQLMLCAIYIITKVSRSLLFTWGSSAEWQLNNVEISFLAHDKVPLFSVFGHQKASLYCFLFLIFSHSFIEFMLLSLKSSIYLFAIIKSTVIFLYRLSPFFCYFRPIQSKITSQSVIKCNSY